MGYLESSAQREIHCSKKAHIKTEDFKSITSLYTSESQKIKIKLNQKLPKIKKYRIIAKINEILNRKTMERINKTKSWFFDEINKMGKTSAKLRQKEKV